MAYNGMSQNNSPTQFLIKELLELTCQIVFKLLSKQKGFACLRCAADGQSVRKRLTSINYKVVNISKYFCYNRYRYILERSHNLSIAQFWMRNDDVIIE